MVQIIKKVLLKLYNSEKILIIARQDIADVEKPILYLADIQGKRHIKKVRTNEKFLKEFLKGVKSQEVLFEL